jgi:hypothetical protein
MDILHVIISQCEKEILSNYKKGLEEYFNSYETSRRLIKCLILSSIYYDYRSNDKPLESTPGDGGGGTTDKEAVAEALAGSFYRSVTVNEWPKAIIEVFLQYSHREYLSQQNDDDFLHQPGVFQVWQLLTKNGGLQGNYMEVTARSGLAAGDIYLFGIIDSIRTEEKAAVSIYDDMINHLNNYFRSIFNGFDISDPRQFRQFLIDVETVFDNFFSNKSFYKNFISNMYFNRLFQYHYIGGLNASIEDYPNPPNDELLETYDDKDVEDKAWVGGELSLSGNYYKSDHLNDNISEVFPSICEDIYQSFNMVGNNPTNGITKRESLMQHSVPIHYFDYNLKNFFLQEGISDANRRYLNDTNVTQARILQAQVQALLTQGQGQAQAQALELLTHAQKRLQAQVQEQEQLLLTQEQRQLQEQIQLQVYELLTQAQAAHAQAQAAHAQAAQIQAQAAQIQAQEAQVQEQAQALLTQAQAEVQAQALLTQALLTQAQALVQEQEQAQALLTQAQAQENLQSLLVQVQKAQELLTLEQAKVQEQVQEQAAQVQPAQEQLQEQLRALLVQIDMMKPQQRGQALRAVQTLQLTQAQLQEQLQVQVQAQTQLQEQFRAVQTQLQEQLRAAQIQEQAQIQTQIQAQIQTQAQIQAQIQALLTQALAQTLAAQAQAQALLTQLQAKLDKENLESPAVKNLESPAVKNLPFIFGQTTNQKKDLTTVFSRKVNGKLMAMKKGETQKERKLRETKEKMKQGRRREVWSRRAPLVRGGRKTFKKKKHHKRRRGRGAKRHNQTKRSIKKKT